MGGNTLSSNDGYMNRIRGRVTDIGSSSTDDLQNEILGEMAQSLTKTEDFLVLALNKLEIVRAEVEDAKARDAQKEMMEAVGVFRDLYKLAHQRRQDLLIHRQVSSLPHCPAFDSTAHSHILLVLLQACGFKVNNHQLVLELFPLPRKYKANGELAEISTAKAVGGWSPWIRHKPASLRLQDHYKPQKISPDAKLGPRQWAPMTIPVDKTE
jgi:hypothetical protein